MADSELADRIITQGCICYWSTSGALTGKLTHWCVSCSGGKGEENETQGVAQRW